MSARHHHYYSRRWIVVGLSCLLFGLILAIVVFRDLGESKREAARIDAAIARQDARQATILAKLELEIRGDCPFKLDVTNLPAAVIRARGKPSTAVLELATSARSAFIAKGCPFEKNPKTGKPFGPPPPVRTK